jgi:hypothetical protein
MVAVSILSCVTDRAVPQRVQSFLDTYAGKGHNTAEAEGTQQCFGTDGTYQEADRWMEFPVGSL